MARIARAYRRYGAIGTFRRIPMLFDRIFERRHIIFLYNKGKSALMALPEGVKFERFTKESNIPLPFAQELVEEEGDVAVRRMLELFDKGACFWLIFHEREVVGFWWTIRASNLNRWFIDLLDEDVVLFNSYTFRAWRGKHISPAVAEAIVAQETSKAGRAYIDIAAWNKASLKSIAKTGFEQVR